MQPPCFLLKRYLEVNPAFYRTSPLSFLVTPPVTFSHWLLALAASFDASCRLTLSTPSVDSIIRRLLSSCSLCPTPPPGVYSYPSRRRLLVSFPVPSDAASWCLPLSLCPHRPLVLLLPPSVPRRLLAPWSLETVSLSHHRLPTLSLPTLPVLSASAPHPFLPIPSARPLFVQSCSSR